jgi:hypothetical protein
VVRGLRGRLLVDASRQPIGVVLELENAGTEPLVVVLDDPSTLEWALERNGVAMDARYGRTEILCVLRWERLAPGQRVRARVDHVKDLEEGGGAVDLDLFTAAWRLEGRGAALRGTYRVEAATAPPGAWCGTLALPAVAIDPPPSAP